MQKPASPEKSATLPASQPTMMGFTTRTKEYSSSDPRRQAMTNALVMFIAGDLLPASVVDSANFRAFLRTLDPCYTVPSRQYFTHALLRQKSQYVTSALRSQLQQAQAVSLTIDLWSNRQIKGFIGITGHFVLDWTMHSVMLSCSRFCRRHTAENIAQQVEETLSCIDIGDKITISSQAMHPTW